MKLTIGFSPCPNDTFIFDALINQKIDTQGIEFEVFMEDVEALNRKAFAKQLDITKLSYHAFAYLTNDYVLLDSGSALGNNCGPLLIAKSKFSDEEINTKTIAIPGKYTTANFLFQLAYPNATQTKEMIFSAVENSILNEEVDAGVIIHENRFTYHDKGLVKIKDLGEYWENQTGYPIPLGGIVIKRTVPHATQILIEQLLKQSVEYAFKNPNSSKEFVRQNAQEMDEAVIKQHIDLYVNHYAVSLGDKGKAAIKYMYEKGKNIGILPNIQKSIFINK